jgi:hypothetical protein
MQAQVDHISEAMLLIREHWKQSWQLLQGRLLAALLLIMNQRWSSHSRLVALCDARFPCYPKEEK